jgi:hypothetical protein
METAAQFSQGPSPALVFDTLPPPLRPGNLHSSFAQGPCCVETKRPGYGIGICAERGSDFSG